MEELSKIMKNKKSDESFKLRVDKDGNISKFFGKKSSMKAKSNLDEEVGKIISFNKQNKAKKIELRASALSKIDNIDLDSFIGLSKKKEEKVSKKVKKVNEENKENNENKEEGEKKEETKPGNEEVKLS